MYLKLLMYLSILCLGMLIGYKDLLGKKLYKHLDLLQTIAVLGLLFAMGLRMGLDKEVINSIGKIGYSAAIIAIFAVGFSMIFVFAARKIILETFARKKLEAIRMREESRNEY